MTDSVAVLGCGYWGKNLVRNFANLNALSAVSDANPETAKQFAEQYKVPHLSLDEILKHQTINAVVIALPAEQHYSAAKQALLAGKHVFVEKPLALELKQAQELCELAKTHNKILMVGHLLHYHSAFIQLKTMVHNGDLGRIQYVYSNRLNLGKFRREENILWSFAPHDISMILSLIGQTPEAVFAEGARYLHNEIADVTTTHLQFAGGEQAHIFVSWLHPFKEQKLVVVGEKTMAVFDDSLAWNEKLTLYPHEIKWHQGIPTANKATAQAVEVEESEPLKNECQHFLDCIANNQQPITDGEEGYQVLQVLDAAERSMNSQQKIKLNSKATSKYFTHQTAVVDEACKIGEHTKIWHFSHLMSGAEIGERCVIGQNVMIGPEVKLGDGCKIQNNVSLYKGVVLEDDVFCGPSCVFTNVNTPRAHIERKNEFAPTLVKKGATIGANATIVCGVTLGEYCFVAAGAVVTKDVPAHALVAGVPAKQIGWVSESGEKLDADFTCPRTGKQYLELQAS